MAAEKCLHRERQPVRQCPECGAYLSSANDDDYCSLHGGWIVQKDRYDSKASRDSRADLFAELSELVPSGA